METKRLSMIPVKRIEQAIFLIRGHRVKTKALNQAVKRNPDRFPDDFMFQLTFQEFQNLRSQFVTSNRGGRRHPPYAFTEQGVAMLSSVLHGQRAIQVNVEIMRAFVRLRQILASHQELARKIEDRKVPN